MKEEAKRKGWKRDGKKAEGKEEEEGKRGTHHLLIRYSGTSVDLSEMA
jgi:hypothetical protein